MFKLKNLSIEKISSNWQAKAYKEQGFISLDGSIWRKIILKGFESTLKGFELISISWHAWHANWVDLVED